MKALVTGATGLVGNAVVRALHARGEEVRALVRDANRAEPMLPGGVALALGDITDPSTLPAAVAGVDVVLHAAGMPEQWARDKQVFDRVNRIGTRNVLQAALESGIRRVVYTSTMDVFREGPDGLLRETEVDPHPKRSTYERSKQAAEAEADQIRAKGLEVVLLNPCSVYGPSPMQTGLNEFFVRMLAGKAPMVPPGGLSIAFVEEVAAAHLAAVDRGVDGERYLLADDYVSMRELAEITARVAGLKRVPGVAPAWLLRSIAAISEPLAKVLNFSPMVARDSLDFLFWNARCDATKARTELGYRPTPIEDGVRRTVDHIRG